LSVAISDGAARITYQEPAREQLDEAKRLAIQGSQKANQRDFRAAADLFTKALAANPAMSETHRDLAMARYELGDFAAAKDHLIDALRLAPDDAWNHVVLANIFTRENDLGSAIRFFTRALELKPGDPYALSGLGAANAKSGHDAQAHECFDAAIAAHPDMFEPRFGKALLLQKQGRLFESAEVLEDLIERTSASGLANHPATNQARSLLASVNAKLREQGGPTNPELLQKKHPAAVWYLLDALKRFDSLDSRRVMEIAFEIAKLGESGLDYASPEKKYSLYSCPGESFSGHQLMCLMFAGFKRIAPEQDTGMDLNEPWITALEMFNSGK
jgi:tetratricopeptide (TPR) repeat protein